MEKQSSKGLETVEIDGYTYEIYDKKPVRDKKFHWHLYVMSSGQRFLVTQMGPNMFSKLHPLD